MLKLCKLKWIMLNEYENCNIMTFAAEMRGGGRELKWDGHNKCLDIGIHWFRTTVGDAVNIEFSSGQRMYKNPLQITISHYFFRESLKWAED